MATSSLFSSSTFKRLLSGILLEFGPIFIFLVTFPHFHIYKATMLLMVSTIISTIVTYVTQKRLPYLALYVALLTIGFGYLTLAHQDPKFIQMRDSLYDLICAFTLTIGLMINIPVLKIAFHDIIPMTYRAWTRLTYLWIGFFLVLVICNEYVRRYYTLEEWFNYKGYVVAVTMLFGFVVLYCCYQKPGELETK